MTETHTHDTDPWRDGGVQVIPGDKLDPQTAQTPGMSRATAIVSGRRGQILGFDGRPGWDGWDILEVQLPEAEMSGLIVDLRSATSGVASYTCRFDHLAEVVGKHADAIVAAHASSKANGVY